MSDFQQMNPDEVRKVIATTEAMQALVPEIKALEAECEELDRRQYPALADRCQDLGVKLRNLGDALSFYMPEAPNLTDEEMVELEEQTGPFVGAFEVLHDADARSFVSELVTCMFENAENLRAGDSDRMMRPRALAPYALLAYVGNVLSRPEHIQSLIFQPVFSPVSPKLFQG